MKFKDYTATAWRSLLSNKLRSFLTFGIIAIGLTALICILTSIDGIKNSLTSSFSRLGTNTFSIQNLTNGPKGRSDRNKKTAPIISREEAELFKKKFNWPNAKVSYSFNASFASTLKYQNQKTDPNISVRAVDADYFNISGFEIESGRNFTLNEIESGTNSIILGQNVFKKLFPYQTAKPIGKEVQLDFKTYKIIAILAPRGKSAITNDNIVMVSAENALKNFFNNNVNYAINAEVEDPKNLEPAIEEAAAIFHTIRKLKMNEPDNFVISKSDRLASELFSSLDSIRYATIFIGILTLLSAGIGLMNILLVSINERTREIGLCKALGAQKKNLIYQYLMESVLICQLGGIAGIIIGVLMGNIVSFFVGSSFIIPWLWIITGVVFCFIVGISAGIYPAFKAGNLNPVDALRHE